MDRTAHTLTVTLLAVSNGAAPDWVQLTPISTGPYKAVDGRSFKIENAQAVIAASLANGAIGVDYDHATDLAAKVGQAAPAAGWIEEIKPQGPAGEPGLWGRVKWTPRAEQAIKDGEYRFISPVTLSPKNSDTVVAIARAALTNDPALTMKGLFHKQQETTDLDKEICAALGLPETATKDDCLAAIKKMSGGHKAMASREKLLMTAAGLTGDALDDAMTAALCTKLKVPAATGDAPELQNQVDDLQKRLAALDTSFKGQTAAQAVENAIKAGKISPAQKEWAISYCTREPEEFKKFVDKQPTILADGRIAPSVVADGALSPDELALCSKLSIKPEDFKATKKAQQEALS